MDGDAVNVLKGKRYCNETDVLGLSAVGHPPFHDIRKVLVSPGM